MSGAVKFAYVVVAVTRKHDPALDVTHAPAAPQIGDVVVFPSDMGRGAYIREDDHGAIVDIVHLHFVATGRQTDTGDVEFDYEAKRLLALLQIGANAERVLHAEIDRVFEGFEEYLDRAHAVEPNEEHLQRLRRKFA